MYLYLSVKRASLSVESAISIFVQIFTPFTWTQYKKAYLSVAYTNLLSQSAYRSNWIANNRKMAEMELHLCSFFVSISSQVSRHQVKSVFSCFFLKLLRLQIVRCAPYIYSAHMYSKGAGLSTILSPLRCVAFSSSHIYVFRIP
jgi:hypothetical protein